MIRSPLPATGRGFGGARPALAGRATLGLALAAPAVALATPGPLDAHDWALLLVVGGLLILAGLALWAWHHPRWQHPSPVPDDPWAPQLRPLPRPGSDAEQRFRAFFEHAPTVATLVDEATGRYVAVNAAFERLAGLPATQVVGRTGVELGLIHPQTEAQLRVALGRWGALHGEPVPVCAADGTARLLRYFAVRQRLGERTVLLGQLEDVTVADGLLRALKALPALAEHAGHADFDRMLLRGLAEALAAPLAFLAVFGDAEPHRVRVRAVQPQGALAEVEVALEPLFFAQAHSPLLPPPPALCAAFVDAQGQPARPESLAMVAVRGVGGRPLGLLGLQLGLPHPDSTVLEAILPVFADRVAAEMGRTRAALRGLAFDQDVLGVALCDADGRMVEVNAALAGLLGRPAGALVGQLFAALTHPEDRSRLGEAMTTSAASGAPSDLLGVELRLARGADAWLQAQVRWRTHQPRAHRDPPQSGPAGHRLAFVQDIGDRKRAEAQIERLAWTDPVTQLPNRSLFVQRLEASLARARRTGEVFAVHFLDLDHFKNVNDTLGHPLGDRLLAAVALRLQATVREVDTVARMGGDEFAILQVAVDGPDQAGRLAERLVAALDEPFTVAGHIVHSGGSVGVACVSDAVDTVTLMEQADMALYRAKNQGRGRYAFHTPALGEAVRARIGLGDDLRVALRSREGAFGIAYQPIVDLSTGALVGVEALARWRHPSRGAVGPQEFVPIAEDRGLLAELTLRVLTEAAHAVASWNVGRPVPLRLCINLSPLDLRRSTLVAEIGAVLAESGLRPMELVCELTEQALAGDVEGMVERMETLRRTGVGFWLDDFGTGASSLKVLRHLPLQGLKVAQDFVRTMLDADGDAETVRATVSIGLSLGWTVVAEGVELATQASVLRTLGCSLAQGHHICPPLPGPELARRYRLRGVTPPGVRRLS